MGGVSVVAASAMLCAVVSLPWVAAGPAQADGGDAGAVGAVGSAVRGVVAGAGDAVAGAGDAVGGAAGGVGSTVGEAVGDGGQPVRDAAGAAGRTVSDAGRAVGGAIDRVARSAGVPAPPPAPPHAPAAPPPPAHRAAPPVGSAPHGPGGPGAGPGESVSQAAGVPPATGAAPAARTRARPSALRDRPRPRHVSPAARSAARRLILASIRPEWLRRHTATGSGGRPDVVIPESFYDEACRSDSLAAGDLRRCAVASMRIPELGGPSSALLALGLAMIGAGLGLVARRRRVTPVARAVH